MNQGRQKPVMRMSEEADEQGLRFAREEGNAYTKTLHYMVDTVAQRGENQYAGDYLVAYAVEKAEGLYHLREGQLRWEEPEEGNIHIEVAICDADDGRFVPGLTVHVTLIGPEGNEIGTHRQPFLWHPYLYHYGRNWNVPSNGEYTLRVRIEGADFPRHDKINGKRYGEPVEVEFRGVKLETGQN